MDIGWYWLGGMLPAFIYCAYRLRDEPDVGFSIFTGAVFAFCWPVVAASLAVVWVLYGLTRLVRGIAR